MQILPTDLDRSETGIIIQWSDGTKRDYAAATLRKHCECATCREKQRQPDSQPTQGLPVLSMAEAQPLRIESMRPVGNYGYHITFSDGHDSGIFTFERLYAEIPGR